VLSYRLAVGVSDRVTARMEMKKVCKDLSNSGGYGEKAKVLMLDVNILNQAHLFRII